MIKTLIVDDEPLAQDIIETYVNQLPNLELVAKCSDAIAANQVLQNNEVDLIFLDIQMPQLTGIEFMKSLSNPPLVVFTTAYSEYAVEGFEMDAVDYLLKPISIDRFMKAVNKVEDRLKDKQGGTGVSVNEDHFFVKADKKLVKVNFNDILYIEGLKDYVIIRQEEGRVITLQTMKSLESKLPANNFKRIHRSYIVNTTKINALVGNMVEIKEKGENKNIPVGKIYREELLAMINEKKL